jgi:hypothetical protein
VEVRARTCLIGPRLGRERRDHPVLGRDAADGLAVRDLVVGRAEGRRVADRQLLLAPAQLGMRQLDGQALVGERRDDVLDDRLGRLHADRAEAQAPVDRHEAVVGPVREIELVLERRVERQPLRGRGGDLSLEEVPRVEGPRLVVQLDHIHEHLAAARGVRQHDERLRVGHEPDLANGPVRRVRRERVDARE